MFPPLLRKHEIFDMIGLGTVIGFTRCLGTVWGIKLDIIACCYKIPNVVTLFWSENVVTVLQAFHTQWGKSENGENSKCAMSGIVGMYLVLIAESLIRCRWSAEIGVSISFEIIQQLRKTEIRQAHHLWQHLVVVLFFDWLEKINS